MIHKTSDIQNTEFEGNVSIGAFCIIGSPPEKVGVYPDSPFGVEIGEGTVLHGHNTIDAGVKRVTKIGKNCWLMKAVHVGHCAQIGDNVIIAPHAVIGGGVTIGEGCNIGIGVAVHPNVSIPPYCMLGMNCVITKNQEIKPFGIWAGNPARFLKFNQRAVEKFGLTPEEVTQIQNDWINNKK